MLVIALIGQISSLIKKSFTLHNEKYYTQNTENTEWEKKKNGGLFFVFLYFSFDGHLSIPHSLLVLLCNSVFSSLSLRKMKLSSTEKTWRTLHLVISLSPAAIFFLRNAKKKDQITYFADNIKCNYTWTNSMYQCLIHKELQMLPNCCSISGIKLQDTLGGGNSISTSYWSAPHHVVDYFPIKAHPNMF